MTSDESPDQLTTHEYDGIKEYDNPLPSWWFATFLLTVIFGFLYWIHYSVSGAGPTQYDELKQDMAAIEAQQKKSGGGAESEESLAALEKNSETLAKGEQIFSAKCAVCHGPQLQGLIGPNLTDDYWLHGKGKLTEIVETIRKGVLDKGMPNWEAQLSAGDSAAVAVFVHSRHGSNPPNPKAPQGDRVAGTP